VLLVDRRERPEQALEAGFPRRMIGRILRAIASSQFKRRMPLIAKVSARTVGVDFLYPRDWGN